jgi:Ca-activated chloride channel family protein
MKNALRTILSGLSLLLLLVPLRNVSAQDSGAHIRITQVDSSKFPQVTLYISVTDASGEPLAVDPGRIRISENGVRMTPDQVSGSGDIGPLTTLLVMDVSGSMNNAGKLSAAKAAALAYVDLMRPGDQAGLLTFNTKVTDVQPITTDHAALTRAINGLKAENDTAMFDALIKAENILQDVSGRKAIIVLTDGLDNQSKTTAKQVTKAIGTSGLSISTIGLGNPDNAGPYFGLDETVLKSLAEKAGGLYSYADNPAGLTNLYELYGREMQSEYLFTYTSPSTLRDGLERALTVSLGKAASTKINYNPGGVLPEVASPASWAVFVLLMAVLMLLLLVPGVIQHFLAHRSAKAAPGASQKSSGRIKIK